MEAPGPLRENGGAGTTPIPPRTASLPAALDPSLTELEAEAIYILRETAAEFRRPLLLYSIGKDSAVLVHLARKAFAPGPIPFPLLHVDTTWKFREMITFRDAYCREHRIELLVRTNRRGLAQGINPFDHDPSLYTQIMKTEPLRDALDELGVDAAIGGARRDEEPSRTKERIFSFRAPGHRWDAKNQRPELWRTFNGQLRGRETMRVFPLSNWTELDIWRYIAAESVPVVPLYFAKPRPVVARNDAWILVDDDRFRFRPGDRLVERTVRFRTLGCYPLTAAVESEAASISAIVAEMTRTTTSERAGRLIDHDTRYAMEKKKREGYF